MRFLKRALRLQSASQSPRRTSRPWRKPDLTGADAKLRWALKHHETFKRERNRHFKSKSYGLVHDVDSEPGYLLIKARLQGTVPEALSLLPGDMLYNTRAALEYLACELVLNNMKSIGGKTSFPICLTREEFESQRRDKIGRMSRIHQALIERQQPYNRIPDNPLSDPLWLLREVSDEDRHRQIPVAVCRGAEAKVWFTPALHASKFRLVNRNAGPFTKDGAEVERYQLLTDQPVNVRVHSQAFFDVQFSEGPLTGLRVGQILADMGMRVADLAMHLGSHPPKKGAPALMRFPDGPQPSKWKPKVERSPAG